MRLLVDMPLSPELAHWFRDRGHDAIHALEVGLDRTSDLDVIMQKLERS